MAKGQYLHHKKERNSISFDFSGWRKVKLMKIGIITDAYNMGLDDLIRVWAVKKALGELDAQPVIINQSLEPHKEKAPLQKAEELLEDDKALPSDNETSSIDNETSSIDDVGNKSNEVPLKRKILRAIYKTEQEEDNSRAIPSFVSSNFTICEGELDTEQGAGTLKSMDYNLVYKKKLYDELTKLDYIDKKCLFYMKDIAVLADQNRLKELAVKEQQDSKFILVDMKYMIKEKKEFIKKLAKERNCRIIHNAMETIMTKTIATYQRYELNRFIGYALSAELIITDTYAGAFVSAAFEKEFICFSNGDKEKNALLRQLKLENHLITGLEEYQGEKTFHFHNKPAYRRAIQILRDERMRELKNILHVNDMNAKVNCPTDILKSECCGCSACALVCPKDAITMKEDFEGFLYPVVNHDKCIDCNLCVKACVKRENPQTVAYEESYPHVKAVMNNMEEVRLNSSSGGIFPELVKYAINEKHGVVVGVRYNEKMQAVADIADNLEDCKAFYGAKYVKSNFSGVFGKIKELLNEGKFVLYSGLPCEAASLKAYLRKPYENLLICEILCHASPSPKAFRMYIRYLNRKYKSTVTNIRFRDKRKGWLALDNTLVVEFADREPLVVNARKNNYYRCFSKDIISRPGCADCSFTYNNRVGDITMGDFWGIQHVEPELFDNKGTSVLMINTPKGEQVWNQISSQFKTKDFDIVTAFKYNHKKPIQIKEERNEFFQAIDKEKINQLLEKYNDLKKKAAE